MGLFNKKPKVVKEIHDAAWGELVRSGLDVDTLTRDVRCVERVGPLNGKGVTVTFMRVFRISEAQKKGVEVAGWETFDQHPDLILYEGYLAPLNKAFLERKRE